MTALASEFVGFIAAAVLLTAAATRPAVELDNSAIDPFWTIDAVRWLTTETDQPARLELDLTARRPHTAAALHVRFLDELDVTQYQAVGRFSPNKLRWETGQKTTVTVRLDPERLRFVRKVTIAII